MRTFQATLPGGDVVTVKGKGLQSACMRLTGFRVRKALEKGLVLSIVEVL